MKVLVTNDDGIDAVGIRELARQLVVDGHDVTVVAPAMQQSGTAAGIGGEMEGRFIAYTRPRIPGLEKANVLAIESTPATAVLASLLGLVPERPDLVVSGINLGHNFGRLAIHSGTLGAALTGATYGVPAVAISCSQPPEGRFIDASRFISSFAHEFMRGIAPGDALNINYPDVERHEVKGIMQANLAAPDQGDAELEELGGGFRLHLRRKLEGLTEDTDAQIVRNGYISVGIVEGGVAGPSKQAGLIERLREASLAHFHHR